MKNKKTLLFGGLTMLMAAIPMVAAVSCTKPSYGASDGSNGGYFGTASAGVRQTQLNIDGTTFELSQAVIDQSRAFLDSNAQKFPILSNHTTVAAEIEKLTPHDIRQFSVEGEITEGNVTDGTSVDSKIDLMNEIQSFLLELFYLKNTTTDFNRGVAKYLNNQSLTINTIDGRRGPWVTDRSSGGSPSFIDENLHWALNDQGYPSLEDSRIKVGTKNELVTYNTVAGTALDDRRSDPSFITGNVYINTEGIATTLPLIRTKTIGEDRYEHGVNGAQGSWAEKRQFETVFSGCDKIAVNGHEYTSPNDANLIADLNNPTVHDLTFKVAPGTKYVDFNGNETEFELTGRDYFLGLVHNFYTDKGIREGTRSFEKTHLPKLTDDELNAIKAEFGDNYSDLLNKNYYLYDLYNIDIPATVDANEALTEDRRKTDFVVKFQQDAPITPTALQMFTDTSAVAPVSYMKIKSMNQNSTINEPGKYFGISNFYAPVKNNGSAFDLSNWITVAPYYYSKYDVTPSSGSIEIKKNTHFKDTTFATSNETLNKYTINMKPTTVDKGSWATQRKDTFINSQKSGELILDADAMSSKAITDALTVSYPMKKRMTRPFQTGYVGEVTWSPYGFYDPKFNEKGRQLMFGGTGDGVSGKPSEMENDFDTFTGFLDGNGPKLRSIINSSINWYTLEQMYAPNQEKTYWQSIYGPEVEIEPGQLVNETTVPENEVFKKPTFTDDTATLKNIYASNPGSLDASLMTSKTLDAAMQLDMMAKAVGATGDNPAVIPYQTYEFTDTPASQEVEEANKLILAQLNKLTPRVKFVRAPAQSWDEFLSTSAYDMNGLVLLGGFGNDYSGPGTISQQYLTSYTTNTEVEFVYKIVKNWT